LTVTVVDAGLAVPPLLSLRLYEMVSVAVLGSSSVSVVRSAFTCASVAPLIVSVVPPPDGVMVPPPPTAPVFADSTPFVSDRIRVNVSPPVVGDSAIVTVPIPPAWVTPTVAVAGGETDGVPDAGPIEKVSPLVNPPEIALPATSVMPVPELFRLSPIVPTPEAPVTVTV